MDKNNLEERIKTAQKKIRIPKNDENNQSSVGGRLIIDLISGITVGGFLGYHIDKNLGTLPLFTIMLLVLGSFAGLYSFYKEINRK